MKISVAIPTSSLQDESLKIDKTRKISVLARACAIFQIDTIYVYQEGNNGSDGSFISMILKYLETPQFLRRRLFQKVNDLKFAGVLQPLKIPSHITPTNAKKIVAGDISEGVVVTVKGKKFVDVGINQLIQFYGKEIEKPESKSYWGYNVKERSNLFSLLSEWKGNIIITSRKGKSITKENLEKYTKSDESLLVVFGSPEKGVHEIIGGRMNKVQNSKSLNFFPNQATETVRLEEALLGTLAIINAQKNS